MPPVMKQDGRLVVVGGVAAGMSAASRARRLRPDIEIVVLEQGNDVSYGACSLPYYISGVISDRGDLIRYDAEFFRRERRIDVRLGARATRVDPRGRAVAFRSADGPEKTLDYDALVLATGARPVRLPIPGSDLPGVFALRTLDDGDAVRRFLGDRAVERATVVGAGYIGLEMAEALAVRGASVTLLELLPTVLSTYDPDMSAIVERELLDRGIILHKETRVDAFEPRDEEPRVGYVVASGRRFAADLVLVSAGVRPATELASAAGIELGRTGAIRVDRRQVTSEPTVLAAGDCAESPHVVTGRSTWIPLGTTANKHGRIAGENAVGGNVRFGGVAGTNATKVFELEVAQTGLSTAAAGEAAIFADSVKISSTSRSHSYPGAAPLAVKLVFEKQSGRVLGAQIVGREGAAKRVDTVAAALHAGMTVAELAEIDMSYAPPFSPVWDPVLIAASQALKKL